MGMECYGMKVIFFIYVRKGLTLSVVCIPALVVGLPDVPSVESVDFEDLVASLSISPRDFRDAKKR